MLISLLPLFGDSPRVRVGVVLDALTPSFLATLLVLFDGGVSRCSPCFVRRGDRRVDGDAMLWFIRRLRRVVWKSRNEGTKIRNCRMYVKYVRSSFRI